MQKALAWLDRLEHILIASIFLVMVVIYTGAILLREVSIELAQKTEWVDEATRYLMVWMVFLALGLALARGRQIAMTAYFERFSQNTRRIVGAAIDLCGLLFCLYVVWFGFGITQLVYNSGQTSPTLGVSNAVLYLALPVGFLLLALRYALSLFGLIDRRAAGGDAAHGGH